MERIYKYALWLVGQGYDLLGTVAELAVKFASIPGEIVYNMALAAHASRAMGQHFGNNPDVSLGNLIANTSQIPLILGKDYDYPDLVNVFPQVVAPPYQFSGAISIESKTFNSYKTYHSYIGDEGYHTKIYETAKGLLAVKYKVVDGRYVFISKFILGRPILVDFDMP